MKPSLLRLLDRSSGVHKLRSLRLEALEDRCLLASGLGLGGLLQGVSGPLLGTLLAPCATAPTQTSSQPVAPVVDLLGLNLSGTGTGSNNSSPQSGLGGLGGLLAPVESLLGSVLSVPETLVPAVVSSVVGVVDSIIPPAPISTPITLPVVTLTPPAPSSTPLLPSLPVLSPVTATLPTVTVNPPSVTLPPPAVTIPPLAATTPLPAATTPVPSAPVEVSPSAPAEVPPVIVQSPALPTLPVQSNPPIDTPPQANVPPVPTGPAEQPDVQPPPVAPVAPPVVLVAPAVAPAAPSIPAEVATVASLPPTGTPNQSQVIPINVQTVAVSAFLIDTGRNTTPPAEVTPANQTQETRTGATNTDTTAAVSGSVAALSAITVDSEDPDIDGLPDMVPPAPDTSEPPQMLSAHESSNVTTALAELGGATAAACACDEVFTRMAHWTTQGREAAEEYLQVPAARHWTLAAPPLVAATVMGAYLVGRRYRRTPTKDRQTKRSALSLPNGRPQPSAE